MAAIDLLFDVKRESERLHQIVLGALLQRTLLLSRLVPLPSAPAELQLHWEPDGKAYDLGVSFGVRGETSGQLSTPVTPLGSAQAGRRSRVLIEIKLDSPLGEDQVAQQLNPSRFHADDRLLYLLLGYSAITTDRALLRRRAQRIAEHTSRPDLLDRISLRDATDIIPLLADPLLLPPGPDHRDARDLATAYRDALLALDERTRRFASRPIGDWQDGDYYGFFAACRARGISGLAHANIGRYSGGEGSVVACSFAETALPLGQGQLELVFENARLCFRLHALGERKALRQRVVDVFTELGLFGVENAAPGPLTQVPLRLSATMTVAQREGLFDRFPQTFDWARFTTEITAAEEILRKVAARLSP